VPQLRLDLRVQLELTSGDSRGHKLSVTTTLHQHVGGSMAEISVRKLAILGLLNAPDSRGVSGQPIAGATRLQKLLFLVDRKLVGMSLGRALRTDLNFSPQRFGPADVDVYPDLEFLTALGHVSRRSPETRSRDSGLSLESPEEATERALSFSYLMGDEEEAGLLAEAEGEVEEYRITEDGRALIASLVAGADARTREACERVLATAADVRQRFGAWPLQRLLRFVYSEYPEMTTASEIRHRVLGHD
jgi:hypothetical protein